MQTESNTFEPLICISRIDETADTATFEFKKLDDAAFNFKAGQFLTFAVEIADKLECRAYSISSSPMNSESVAVTIKRVNGGKVSNHLLDHLQTGMTLPAMAPAGEFTLQDQKTTEKLLLMCAGSGITPCISMARWLLESNQKVNIHFIYSALSEADVIMAKVLDALNKEFANFHLTRIIEKTTNANDIQGILDLALFKKLIPDTRGRTIFTCGPEAYMEAIESFAQSTKFDMTLFHKESFVADKDNRETTRSDVNYQIVVPQYAKTFTIAENQTLLDALESAGIPISTACRNGFCGACKCKVKGNVKSASQQALTAEQIKQGYVLSCTAIAYSDLVVEL